MANPNGTVRNLRPFTTGQSGNPGGKPKGARNKLQSDFLTYLTDDFEQHGKDAIVAMRENDPSGYIRVIASLLPKEKEPETKRPLEEMAEDELLARIEALWRYLAAQEIQSEWERNKPQ